MTPALAAALGGIVGGAVFKRNLWGVLGFEPCASTRCAPCSVRAPAANSDVASVPMRIGILTGGEMSPD